MLFRSGASGGVFVWASGVGVQYGDPPGARKPLPDLLSVCGNSDLRTFDGRCWRTQCPNNAVRTSMGGLMDDIEDALSPIKWFYRKSSKLIRVLWKVHFSPYHGYCADTGDCQSRHNPPFNIPPSPNTGDQRWCDNGWMWSGEVLNLLPTFSLVMRVSLGPSQHRGPASEKA